MRVIDLLNKIANTKNYKDIPKKVKITTGSLKEEYRIWVWDGLWYVYEEDGEDVCICTEKLDLNDKVEIIEDKKIEKLDQTLNRLDISDDYYRYIMENRFKINEIIDYLEEK